MTAHRCFLPRFGSFGQAVSELKKSANQKQESPVAEEEDQNVKS
jgi:hypothetical protein